MSKNTSCVSRPTKCTIAIAIGVKPGGGGGGRGDVELSEDQYSADSEGFPVTTYNSVRLEGPC